MGDRGNILVTSRQASERIDDEHPGVFVYTHWHGYRMHELAARALDSTAGRDRWNDDSYLTRIIADVVSEEIGRGPTGMGISDRLQDNEHAIVVVDPATQTVWFSPEGSYQPNEGAQPFEEFIAWAKGAEMPSRPRAFVPPF